MARFRKNRRDEALDSAPTEFLGADETRFLDSEPQQYYPTSSPHGYGEDTSYRVGSYGAETSAADASLYTGAPYEQTRYDDYRAPAYEDYQGPAYAAAEERASIPWGKVLGIVAVLAVALLIGLGMVLFGGRSAPPEVTVTEVETAVETLTATTTVRDRPLLPTQLPTRMPRLSDLPGVPTAVPSQVPDLLDRVREALEPQPN